eukprot:SAG11_NODE_435_length_9493_cov_21.529806_1_plen_300_part_00
MSSKVPRYVFRTVKLGTKNSCFGKNVILHPYFGYCTALYKLSKRILNLHNKPCGIAMRSNFTGMFFSSIWIALLTAITVQCSPLNPNLSHSESNIPSLTCFEHAEQPQLQQEVHLHERHRHRSVSPGTKTDDRALASEKRNYTAAHLLVEDALTDVMQSVDKLSRREVEKTLLALQSLKDQLQRRRDALEMPPPQPPGAICDAQSSDSSCGAPSPPRGSSQPMDSAHAHRNRQPPPIMLDDPIFKVAAAKRKKNEAMSKSPPSPPPERGRATSDAPGMTRWRDTANPERDLKLAWSARP